MTWLYSVVGIVLTLAICFLVASFWHSKGRSFIAGFFTSLFLTPLIGILIGMLIPADIEVAEQNILQSGKVKKCPYCAELIRSEAIICRYCGKDV